VTSHDRTVADVERRRLLGQPPRNSRDEACETTEPETMDNLSVLRVGTFANIKVLNTLSSPRRVQGRRPRLPNCGVNTTVHRNCGEADDRGFWQGVARTRGLRPCWIRVVVLGFLIPQSHNPGTRFSVSSADPCVATGRDGSCSRPGQPNQINFALRPD
jgi:hypothetical protein